MKPNTIRTSIDLPRDLHRQLHEEAARKGTSARKVILAHIQQGIAGASTPRPERRLDLDKNPLVPPAGRGVINLTNEEIYDLIEFP